MRDEYGQGSILFTDADLEKVVARAKREINSVNVDNALTVEAKKQNWESFMVIIDAEEMEEDFIYAGKDGRGISQVFDANDDAITKLSDVEDEITLTMFCGKLDGEDWFAAVPSRTVRGEEDLIDSLTHPNLQGKNIYYIRPI
jgi:hypothetical protein